MNKRFVVSRLPFWAAVAAAVAVWSGGVCAQNDADAEDDAKVIITSPMPWTTFRSDSISVSVQADTSKLPKQSIDFRVVKQSGNRSSTLFNKSVKMDDVNAEFFLGRARDIPLGGTDYLRIEWSVPGTALGDTALKGAVEPVGVVLLSGEVSADKKWVPSPPAFPAVKLKAGTGDERAAALAKSESVFEVGGMKFAAGWDAEALYILFTPEAGVTGVEFAFDPKCGKNAFLSWADRFVSYTAANDSVSGLHYSKRAVSKNGMTSEAMAWGGDGALRLVKAEAAKMIAVRWDALGLQPFDERNISFSVFVKGRAKQPANHPAKASREIPGTWGDLKLEK